MDDWHRRDGVSASTEETGSSKTRPILIESLTDDSM